MSRAGEDDIHLLCRGILTLDGEEECRCFLEDICTPSEIEELSMRLKAARMLSDGRLYSEISEQTGMSTTTISRVNHCIKYGKGGYTSVLEKIKRMEKR